MLLKDSRQRVFPEDPWSRKSRFGHSVFKFCEEWCIPGSQFHETVGNAAPPKTESQDAYKPVASLKNLVTHIGSQVQGIVSTAGEFNILGKFKYFFLKASGAPN